jgi:hypothetical protein
MIDRLPYDATTKDEVRQYFITRALQMAPLGITWLGNLDEPSEGCFITHFFDVPNNQRYSSFYVTAPHRGKGKAVRAVKFLTDPIITVADCNIIPFLLQTNANFHVATGVFDSNAYQLIEKEYGNQRAKRSKVLLMNHIDEGLWILEHIGASEAAKRAYCLHPLVQTDADLATNIDRVVEWQRNDDPRELILAMEYRNAANAWLSDKVWMEDGLAPHPVYEYPPKLSPLKEVNDMLIADKVQNYKDFLMYHKGTHRRSDQLDTYFQEWLKVLGVDNFLYLADNLRGITPIRFTNPGV